MYKTATITPTDLDKVKVLYQEEIEAIYGEKFDPKKGFALLKKETKDFSQKDEKALETDALFVELLTRDGILKPTVTPPKKPTKADFKKRIEALKKLAAIRAKMNKN